MACERLGWLAHEFDARWRRRLRLTAGEDIVLNFGVEGRPGYAFPLKVERHVVRFPTPQDCVDRFVKRTHAVVTFRRGTVEPVDGAVEPGNKAVGTGGDVDNDFSLADHGLARPNPKTEGLRISIKTHAL